MILYKYIHVYVVGLRNDLGHSGIYFYTISILFLFNDKVYFSFCWNSLVFVKKKNKLLHIM